MSVFNFKATFTFKLQFSTSTIIMPINGLMINEYYKTNLKLNDNIRTLLVDTIISFIITKNIFMSVGLANSIADQIVGIFSTEVIVCILIYYLIYLFYFIF